MHLPHTTNNKYRSLQTDLCITWQLSQLITPVDNKDHKNTKKLFLVFYQTVGVQQKFNIRVFTIFKSRFCNIPSGYYWFK